jgi:hypothetical protein
MDSYVTVAGLAFLCALFGVWMHNVGAAFGWGIAALLALKLWATEHVNSKGQSK